MHPLFQTANRSPLLRISHRDPPARQQLLRALQEGLPLLRREPAPSAADNSEDDYAQIDVGLQVTAAQPGDAPPPARVAYAGLTPTQRHRFLTWLGDPLQPAPAGFRHLYLAQLEVNLLQLDNPMRVTLCRSELARLRGALAWQEEPELDRVLLLGCWLAQDGDGVARWVTDTISPSPLLSVALGWQALLRQPLTAPQLGTLARLWQLTAALPEPEVLKHRLGSIHATLGTEPLAHALGQLESAGLAPRPWRAVHRELRIALPQPDLEPLLKPLLKESLGATLPDRAEPTPPHEEQVASAEDDPGWHLLLEFGHSSSQFFDHVVNSSQKLPGFTQLMDEKRRMVYRVIFKRREMRRFWRLWDYVQNWSTTKIYVNGVEIDKWKVWSQSPHLR